MKRAVALLLAGITLLAGCIAAPDEIEPAATYDSPLLESLRALPTSFAPAGTTVVLRTDVSPAGGLAAFWYTVPEGAVIETADGETKTVQFLAAPVLLEEQRAGLERWMVMSFTPEDGELALDGIAFGAPLTIQGSGLTGDFAETVERPLSPFVFGTYGDDLAPGSRIAILVAGVSAQEAELALVLKPLESAWDPERDELPETIDAFLAALGDEPAVALEPAGRGQMHQVALYLEGAAMLGGASLTVGPVDIEGEPTRLVAAHQRQQTFSTSFPSRGFGISAAGYQGQSSVGSFSALAQAHGEPIGSEGLLLALAGPTLAGPPLVAAMGEGEEPGATSLTLDSTTTSAFGDVLFLMEIDIDSTLADLFGLPAEPAESFASGAQIEQAAQGLSLTLGDVRILAPGILA